MSSESAALIVLIGSLLGLAFLVFRKIPVLVELPEVKERPLTENLWPGLKERAKKLPGVKSFSFEVFLQKVLSRFRVLTLKTDNKTSNWLQKLRERSKKKNFEDGNYWQELKKFKDRKD